MCQNVNVYSLFIQSRTEIHNFIVKYSMLMRYDGAAQRNRILHQHKACCIERAVTLSLRCAFCIKGEKIMIHIFDTEIAVKYGVNAAVLLQNIGFWIKQNEANETNFYDGTYWTYNSRRAYRELFPYMSERQIDTAFRKLIDDGLVITGNYNKVAYDRTLWYALTQKGKCILHFDGMDSTETQNADAQNVRPIPDINPVSKQKIKNKDILDEFEILWKLYPRKIGKPKALKAYEKARKNGTTFEQVKQGIEMYLVNIKQTKTATEYIKHGSTWFNGECWNDEYSSGVVTAKSTDLDEIF